ncbi:MAG: oligosaccharide repeat unit polymerase [Bacteroidales bacterium]|nr:oligosaccharide repeat unit polymerase [Bacteroidales bacterium]
MATILIIIIFLLMLFIVNKIGTINKFSKRMLTLYIAYWGIMLTLSSIGVADLYRPSNFALLTLFMAVLSFVVGFSLQKQTLYEKKDINIESFNFLDEFINSKGFIFLLFLAFVMSGYYFMKMRTALAFYEDLGEIRGMFFDNSLLGYYFIWLNHLFLQPMKYVCVLVFAYMLLYKRNWKFIIVTLFLLFYTSLSGGRFGYLSIAIGVLFVYYVFSHNIKLKLKHYILLFTLAIFFFALISEVTSMRTGKGSLENSINAFLSYLCGPATAFDYAINNNYVEKLGGYQFGRYTFSAVDGLLMYFFNMLGVDYGNLIAELVEIKQNTQIVVGSGKTWNALYTGTLYYWLDGGFIGCIVFPFVVGMLFRWIVKLYFRYKTWAFLCLIAMFFQMKMHSVCDFSLYSPFLLLSIVYLYFIGRYTKVSVK